MINKELAERPASVFLEEINLFCICERRNHPLDKNYCF
jgi:hypothetical protein